MNPSMELAVTFSRIQLNLTLEDSNDVFCCPTILGRLISVPIFSAVMFAAVNNY